MNVNDRDGFLYRRLRHDTVLVRYSGEIGVKSRGTARTLLNLLARNIRARLSLHRIDFSHVSVRWGRILIKSDDCDRAATQTSRVFGVVSTSPALSTEADLDVISELAVNYARDILKPGSTFAVRSRRAGRHPFTSEDVARRVGSAILNAFRGEGVSVDLTSPDEEIYIEVRDEDAYIFHDIVEGVNGLPLGSQGGCVCLISGGLDSPVACYMLMKRGCIPVMVYLDNYPFTGEDTKGRAVDIAKKLAEYAAGWSIRMYIVPHGPTLTKILRECERKLTCIICRRMMLRVAERIAGLQNAEAIVTGESMGEKASQTLRNLKVTNTAVAELPVLRPLVGMDKEEIVELAKKLGTFDISTRPAMCCSVPPKHPATRAKLSEVLDTERNLKVESLITTALKNVEVIEVS